MDLGYRLKTAFIENFEPRMHSCSTLGWFSKPGHRLPQHLKPLGHKDREGNIGRPDENLDEPLTLVGPTRV